MSEVREPGAGATSPDNSNIPSSADPADIQRGLAESPELTAIQKLEKRALALSEEIKQTELDGQKIDPNDTKAMSEHINLRRRQDAEGKALGEEIAKVAGANMGKTAPMMGQKMSLSIPVLNKAIELLIEALKQLMALISRGIGALVNLATGKEKEGSGKAAESEAKAGSPKKSFSLSVPVGGGVSANVGASNPKGPAPATSQEAEDALGKAIEKTTERHQEIKRQGAELEAGMDNDGDSPAPGGKGPKV